MPKPTKEICCGTCPYFEFIPHHSAAQVEHGDGPCLRNPGKIKSDDFVEADHVCGEHPKFKQIPSTAGLWLDNESKITNEEDLKTDPA